MLSVWLFFRIAPPTDSVIPLATLIPTDDTVTTGRLQALYRLEVEAATDGWTPERAATAARHWQAIGQPMNAIAFYELADSPLMLRPLSELYMEVGDWGRAAETLQTLSETASDSSNRAWSMVQLGLIAIGSDPVQARALFLEAIRLEPGYQESLATLLEILRVTTDPVRIGFVLAQSERWFYTERALAYAPDDPLALAFMALAREMQGKSGTERLAEALALAPQNPQVRFVEGILYRLRGQLDASVAAFAQATALDPSNPALYAELGTAYRLIGDLPTAERWLQFALELSDEDPRYSQMIEDLRVEEQNLLRDLALMMGEIIAPEVTEQPDATSEASPSLDVTAEVTPERLAP